ncbi:hypothetical protein [Alteribacillus bidgolensis]|uniref:Uncharacterized protein n=1 Tax=Alteribacillus bidgolensis TaxID=930129 RepID=A0A1G8Q883_9BACI|nr:hypothetical protein [Alteribacillus bidgolensis]SDJ00756.1 hypothetical protein SAMN05216352_11834 [Alteribacillus bidgolensis]
MIIEQRFHQIKAVDSSDLEIELKGLIEQYSENEELFPLLKQVIKTRDKDYLAILDLHHKSREKG